MKTRHWNWLAHNPDSTNFVSRGKQNLLNNFCIAVPSNWPRCTSCHISYGWKDENFDFSAQKNIDFLICHDQTGTYSKIPTGAGYPESSVDLLFVAQSVGPSTRINCGYCHFDGGESFENFKVSESSFTPTSSIFFGDYSNITAWDKKIYPIWSRLQGGQLSVWTTPLIDTTSVTIVDSESFEPKEYFLFQNYPNPFNPSTTISFQLPKAKIVTVKIFDIIGNEVKTIVKENKPAGVHEVNFDASQLSSGIYLYRIDAGTFHQSKKMLLVK